MDRRPQDEIYFAEVARLDAGLGRKEDAIREARQAVGYKCDRAVLCAQADRALTQTWRNAVATALRAVVGENARFNGSQSRGYNSSRTQLTARR